MSTNLLKSSVIRNQVLNYKYNFVTLKTTEPAFTCKAGQFVALKVSDIIFRSYSIASIPERLPEWNMFVDITPQGPGTTYIKNLQPEDTVETTKPAGVFTLEQDSDNYIFGATGCGIASIKPMIEQLLSNHLSNPPNIYLFWGLRYEKDLVWQELWQSLQKDYSNFHYQIVLSKPEGKWLGKTGHIQFPLIELVKKLPDNQTGIYLCGSSEFINETKQTLFQINFPPKQIYFEKYY